MEIKRGRGYVYSLRYHIVFCVKYRHELIKGDIETRLKEMFIEIADNNGFEIVTMGIMPDHVHLLLDCTPQHYIPDILKAIKGNSARFLFKENPELRKKLWGGHLWNPSYFISTVSDITEDVIKDYINSQKKGVEQNNRKSKRV